MITVYVSIGNSDNRLGQAEWSQFYRDVTRALYGVGVVVHGQWVSEPTSAWQNACWCIEFDPAQSIVMKSGATTTVLRHMRTELARIAARYRQDAIAWAEAAATIHIGPMGPPAGPMCTAVTDTGGRADG